MPRYCLTFQNSRRQEARRGVAAALLILVSLLAGCSSQSAASKKRVELGQKVTVAGVAYTVLDATWYPSLGEGAEVRMPSYEYLVIRLAAENGTDAATHMANFRLIATDGSEYSELADGQNVSGWFGISRNLSGKESRQGAVLFDAPRAVYDLQVADEFYDGETGSAALVYIPIRLPANDPPMPTGLD